MQLTQTETKILWLPVFSLAFLNATVMFGYAVYYRTQPQLLENFGYSELAALLSIIQFGIMAVVNPMMGFLSDRLIKKYGRKFTLITVGVILAGILFGLVALFHRSQSQWVAFVFPYLMVLWLMAMSAFNSPSVSFLSSFASAAQLPLATSFLSVVTGLMIALNPVFSDIIQFLGTAMAYLLAGLLLGLAAYLFESVLDKNLTIQKPDSPATFPPVVLIFLMGLLIGFSLNWAVSNLPALVLRSLKGTLMGQMNPAYASSIFLALIAFCGLFTGKIVIRLGVLRSLLTGLGSIILLVLISTFRLPLPVEILIILASVFSYSLTSVSAFPFIFSKTHPSHSGLATGCYFCGFYAGFALLLYLIQFGKLLNPLLF